MSKFKNWQMLNEAFGKMLGVSSPAVSFASSMPPSDQDPSMDDSMPSDDMSDDDMSDDSDSDSDSDSDDSTTHVCPNCGFEIEIECPCDDSEDGEDDMDDDMSDDDDDMSSDLPDEEPPYVQEESVKPADDTEFLNELRKEFAGCFTKSSITEDMLIDPKDDPAFFANLPSQSDYEPLNIDDLNLPKVGEEPDTEGLGIFSIFGL